MQKEVAALERGQTAPEAAEPNAQSEVSTETINSRIPASGSYGGEAQQRGTPTRINKNYPMQMSFSSGGSRIMYPTLGCEGVLQPLGFQGASRAYEEKITSGHCDSGGTWLVHVDGPTTIRGGLVPAFSLLHRVCNAGRRIEQAATRRSRSSPAD